MSDVSSQFEAASSRLAEATAAVESSSAASEEAQKELVAKSQQIAQLQMSLSEAEEQLVSITAREARSLEAEARRCVSFCAILRITMPINVTGALRCKLPAKGSKRCRWS